MPETICETIYVVSKVEKSLNRTDDYWEYTGVVVASQSEDKCLKYIEDAMEKQKPNEFFEVCYEIEEVIII